MFDTTTISMLIMILTSTTFSCEFYTCCMPQRLVFTAQRCAIAPYMPFVNLSARPSVRPSVASRIVLSKWLSRKRKQRHTPAQRLKFLR